MDSFNASSRFLMQASLGANRQTISDVAKIGIEPWLDQQLASKIDPNSSFARSTQSIWKSFRRRLKKQYGRAAINGEGNNPALPYKWYFHMAWWHHTLTSKEDLLRQRVAQALSEILVISDNSSLELDAVGMGSYYDLLYQHAFGNFDELLLDVTMHPTMGVYLSHMNNQKAVPAQHIHPDENFAREIMQLFSIGLFELEPDGSHKLDSNGQSIPSYDNRDIKELARVFTGLRAHSYDYEWTTSFWAANYNGYRVGFNDGIDKTYKTVPFVNMTQPMVIDEKYHDREPKRLLNGFIDLPGRQSGKQEIKTVVRKLTAHPNAAPFIARHLINQLVTSNPSAQYVEAVAAKFGPRGNLKAVVREVLSYPLHNKINDLEFKSAYKPDEHLPKTVQSQKLKSPLLRATQILLSFGAHNDSKKLWVCGDDIEELLKQHPLSAPTVFNFYKPDFVPHGPLELAELLAPEFELHTSATSIAYVNMMYYWLFGDYYPAVSTQLASQEGVHNVPELDPEVLKYNDRDRIRLDFSAEIAIARNPRRHDELIDRVSASLTGKTNLSIKSQIKKAFANYNDNPLWVVQTIVFMIAISPEFTVMEA